ncbi:SDR family NAD(P)-dependent oxidoreductase, partial [Streptomyces sp. NPDC003877]
PLRLIEISPHPVARHSLERILAERPDAAVLTTGRRDTPDRRGLEQTAARLWQDGADLDRAALAGQPRRAELATPVVLTVSGRTRPALAANAARLADRLAHAAGTELRDLAYSSTVTRAHLDHRAAVVAATTEEAAEALTALAEDRPHPAAVEDESEELTGAWGSGTSVLFTGQGSQRPGMGRALHAAFPVFRDTFDAVCRALDPHLARPLHQVLLAPQDSAEARLLDETEFTQPALFAFEVALHRLWESWGVRPRAVAGHSIGELAAAHVAGVLDLDDAARLVAARGRLMQSCQRGGAMASVQATEAEVLQAVAPVARSGQRVSLAALNSPTQTVVSGDEEAVVRVVEHFAAQGRRTRRLTVSHAFHSAHMDSMLDAYRAVAEQCVLRVPEIPLFSTATGTWTDSRTPPGQGATSPEHWVRQVRDAVRFTDAVAALEAAGLRRHLECGPAAVLTAMGVACTDREEGFIPSQRAGDRPDEVGDVLRALAALHVSGEDLDFEQVYADTGAHRTDLPPYAFRRTHHWIEAAPRPENLPAARPAADDALWQAVGTGEAERICALLGTSDTTAVEALLPHLAAWREQQDRAGTAAESLYEDSWHPLTAATTPDLTGDWLLATPADPAATALTQALAQALTDAGGTVHPLPAADSRTAYAAALETLTTALAGRTPRAVLALTCLDTDPAGGAVTTGATRTLALTQALGDSGLEAPLWLVTRGAVRTGAQDQAPRPDQALAWGLGHVTALEHADRWGGLVDLPTPAGHPPAGPAPSFAPLDTVTTGHLLSTVAARTPDREDQVALRPAGPLGRRLRRSQPPAPHLPWQARGTVLITGGSGALAGHLARHLAGRGAEHIVLASRRGPGAEGAAELAAALEAAGTRATLAACDVTDRADLERLLARIDEDSAPLRAVFHTAGTLDDRLLDHLDAEALAATTAPKLQAATHLHTLTADRDLDAFVLYSSVVGTLGNIGQANYAMANAALDALAEQRRADGLPALSIAWGPWAQGGMTQGRAESQLKRVGLVPLAPDAALTALDAALTAGPPTGPATRIAARVDWARAAPTHQAGRARPLLADLAETRPDHGTTPATPAGRDDAANPLRTALTDLADADRLPHLRTLIAVEAAAVLGVTDPASLGTERGFKDLGFDSMMAIQLSTRVQRRTGITTPRTLIYDHPNLTAAAHWLLGELLGTTGDPAAPAPTARRDEPLAIVGVGLRMPGGAHDLDSLWQILAEGRDTVGEIPADRFDIDAYYDPAPDTEGTTYVRHASFLDDVASFDAPFFGISPREADPMDPQHRLLLEAAWNSLENAGIRPDDLRHSRTGVFVGAGAAEYAAHRAGTPDTYTLTGSLQSFNAGRLSYHLGLQGPALSVDTACSSSLVALHLAAEALRGGECDIALAGGVQVLADPGSFVALSRSHALAPDGRSKTFSAEADGYGRGEGVALVVVMRLSDALTAGHDVLGVIRAGAVNHDGASSGITAPNGTSQQKVVRAALHSAQLAPTDIDYVECHGTGTPLGDPVEVQALAAVYGEGRDASTALRLGTAKSVIGHLESAAGIAGVCKVLAAFRHGALPPTPRSTPLNPAIAWDDLPVTVVDELSPWARTPGRVRRAGVSAFGLSGTNAHLVLEEPPLPAFEDAAPAAPRPPALPVVLSGRTDKALREQAGRWARWLDAHPGTALPDIAATAARHRTHFPSRAGVVTTGTEELTAALHALAEGHDSEHTVLGTAEPRGKTVFVFPGQGSQWTAMGRDLLAHSPVFAEAIDRCDAALAPLTGWSVRSVLAGEQTPGTPPADRVDVVQPALFAMGVALAALWRSLGVEPAAVVGHSQGEVVAAVVCGALTLQQGAQVVTARSRAVLDISGRGGMALIERPVAEVEEHLAPYGGTLSIAAVNTTGSTVVSGAAPDLEDLVTTLQQQGVFARTIRVDYASHSTQMDPLLPALATRLADLTPGRATTAFYSTLLGHAVEGPELDGQYWCRNLREPVRFDRALHQLLADGHTVFVEISAHPVLAMPLTDGCADHNGLVVGSLARGHGGLDQLLRNLALLHAGGHTVDWQAALGETPTTLVPLPTYAFQRERHWLDAPEPSADAQALGLQAPAHPWLGAATALADGDGHLLTGSLSLTRQPWLKDHLVFGTAIVPGTGLLELATAAAHEVGAAGVAELTLAAPLVLDDELHLQITVGAAEGGSRTLTVHSRPRGSSDPFTCHATGRLTDTPPTPATHPATPDGFADLARWPVPGADRVPLDGFHDRFRARGIHYGPAFQGLTELWRAGTTAYGLIRLPAPHDGTPYAIHPALLDAALHTMEGAADPDPAAEACGALLPFEWSDTEIHAVGSQELRVRVDLTETPEHGRRLRLWATDPTGAPVLHVGALHLRRADAAQIRAARNTDGLHQLSHLPVEPSGTPNDATADAVIGGTGELAARLGATALPDAAALTARLDTDPGHRPGRVLIDLTGPTQAPDPADPEAAHAAAAAALGELRTLLGDERLATTELTWLTRDSTAAAPGDALDGLAHAPLRGLLRTARTEHPERSLRLIDLGPAETGPRTLARALALTSEEELAIRGQDILTARLTPAPPATGHGTARALDPDGTVLLTGGTGELGAAVARHLVTHHGIRHLVLTSRRGPDAPGAAELTHQLQEEGAQCVRVVACDVSRRDDLAQVLALAAQDRPWTAVLHLAGILDDGVLLGQDTERLHRALTPKVDGAHHLADLTRDLDLAALVLFSSAAGTLGTAGQSVYAAANTWLDAFAARLRAQGRPASSLAWGLWEQAGTGMTAHLKSTELARMRRQGIAPLPLAQGLRLLDAVLGRPAGNYVPARLDLRQLQRDASEGGQVPPLFRSLVRPRAQRAATAGAPAATGLRDRLLAAPAPDRQEIATALVLREVAAVLGLESPAALAPDQVLKDLGLDSLMAVELRRRLAQETGLTLPATLAFDHPTPERIAHLVLDRMDLTTAPAPGQPAAAPLDDDPDATLGWALARLTAARLHDSGLLRSLVELARQSQDSPPATALTPAAAPPEERSVDDINAELDAFLQASGIN